MATIENDPMGVIQSFYFHDSPAPEQEGLFRLLGLVHLYHQSGIHLLVLMTMIESLVRFYGRSTGLSVRIANGVSILILILLGTWVWMLQGFHLSLYRPLMMIFLRKWFHSRGAQVIGWLPFVFTGCLEWVLCFRQGLSHGAIHYYLSVGGARVALESNRHQRGIWFHLKLALYSYVPIAVMDLARDHLVNPLTPLWSLVSVPIVAWGLYPAGLVSISIFGTIHPVLVHLWRIYLDTLLDLLERTQSLFQVSELLILFGGMLTLVLVLTRVYFSERFRRTSIIFGILLALLLVRMVKPRFCPHRVIQWDVGQGDSALFQRSCVNELLDAGPSRGSSPEQWIRRLSRAGVLSIDAMILTHSDLDHRGGLDWISPIIPIHCRVDHESGEGGQICARLLKLRWFHSHSSHARGNEWMGGAYFDLGAKRAWFGLGDGDWEQEHQFLFGFQNEIQSHPHRIWKLGHHGSRYSSAPDFLARMNPDQYWLSVGLKNPYHHPHSEVLRRLHFTSGTLQRTDLDGDLSESSAYTVQWPDFRIGLK